MVKIALLVSLLAVHTSVAGLDRYAHLVVADAPHPEPSRSGGFQTAGIRITYLGTNGYQFEVGNHTLLVDPYFSRIGLSAMIFPVTIRPDKQRIENAMKHLASKTDAIIVTHGHVDHLFDTPDIMRMTGARLLASETAVELAERSRRSTFALRCHYRGRCSPCWAVEDSRTSG